MERKIRGEGGREDTQETPATRDASGTNTPVGVENGSLSYRSLFCDKVQTKQLRRERFIAFWLTDGGCSASRQQYGGRSGRQWSHSVHGQEAERRDAGLSLLPPPSVQDHSPQHGAAHIQGRLLLFS